MQDMLIIKPRVCKIVLAVNTYSAMPTVYLELRSMRENPYWIITNGGYAYMFKDDGTFGWIECGTDFYSRANGFATAEEAIECFHKFHKTNE